MHSLKFTALKLPKEIKDISTLYLVLDSRVNAFSIVMIAFFETETGKVFAFSRIQLSDLNTLISTCSGYSLGHRSDTCENCRNYI